MNANKDRTELLNRRWTQINADEKETFGSKKEHPDERNRGDENIRRLHRLRRLLMGLATSGEINRSFLALAFLLSPSTISELKTKSA
jgi:hypothetical protein